MLSRVQLLVIPWTATYQASPSMGFSRQEYWSGLPLPSHQWTWVWVNSRSWWYTGRPGVLQSMWSQRVGHNWATELNWTEPHVKKTFSKRKPWQNKSKFKEVDGAKSREDWYLNMNYKSKESWKEVSRKCTEFLTIEAFSCWAVGGFVIWITCPFFESKYITYFYINIKFL